MPQSPKRVRGKPLTNDIILERFKAVHGEIYDYSKVIFKTNNDPVIIICTRHGEYLCSPKRHSLGSRCRKCYLEDVNGINGSLTIAKLQVICKAIFMMV